MQHRFNGLRYVSLLLLLGTFSFLLCAFRGSVSGNHIVIGGITNSAVPASVISSFRSSHPVIWNDVTSVWDDMSREEINDLFGRTPRLIRAWKLLDEAFDLWEDGQVDEAGKLWLRIIADYQGLEPAYYSQWNLAQTAQDSGDMQGAIRLMEELIGFPISVASPDEDLNSITNLKHSACLSIADLFLELGDLRSALDYLLLAQQKFQYTDLCGVYVHAYKHFLDEQAIALKTAIREGKRITIAWRE